MKIIYSQGQGRLQLIETSNLVKDDEFKVLYITGWVPYNTPVFIVNFIGKLIGRNHLYQRLIIRQPRNLTKKEVKSCTFSEIIHWVLILFAKLKIISMDNALQKGWVLWGYNSRKYIKNADILHLRSGAGQGGAILTAKKNKIKVIVDHSIAHPKSMYQYLNVEYNFFGQNFDLDPNTKFWSLVIKDCDEGDIILVNSAFVKQTFLEHGYAEKKIKVIYLGVREDFIGIKKDWKIIENQPTRLLFIGSFGFRKGARILIEAIQLLNQENVNVVLDVLSAVDDLKILQEKYIIPQNIIFHGSFLYDELKSFLSTRDIFVFPTFAEGSSRAAMEAMAAGIPVITTPNCGVPIINKQSGLLIPIGDSIALANAIKELIEDQTLRERIGKNAANLILNSYTQNHYVQEIKALYRNVVN